MSSWIKNVLDFVKKLFSFGKKILSEPFFDHVFAIAGLIYPPAAPIIEAVDRLFEQQTQDGFLEQLDQLLERSGLDSKQTGILKHLVCLLLTGEEAAQGVFQDEQKAALTREILKTAIASNTGDFRLYRVGETLRRLLGLDIRSAEDRDLVPDHLVNFAIEFSIVQRKFNSLLDEAVTLAKSAMEPLLGASEEAIGKILEEGRARGLWNYTTDDYAQPETRKAVAALLVKEKAVAERLILWGRAAEKMEHIPDSLANMAVEACYANSKYAVKAAA